MASGLPNDQRLLEWHGCAPRSEVRRRLLRPSPQAAYSGTSCPRNWGGTAFNSLVNPINEELIFRGWILDRLARGRSAGVAIAVSSLLFGLLYLRLVFWLEPSTFPA